MKEIIDAGGGVITDDELNWIIRWPAEDILAHTVGLKKTVTVKLTDDIPVGTTTITNIAEIGFEVIGFGSLTDDPSDNRSSVDTVVVVPEEVVPPEEPAPVEIVEITEEVLPFTGLDWTLFLLMALVLIGSGMLVWRKST